MSFSAIASYPNDKAGIFGQNCEDLSADFFDQFLTFDPIDNEGRDYPPLPESTQLQKSAQENNIGSSSSNLRGIEGKKFNGHEPDWKWALNRKPALPHYIPAQGNHFYSELSGRAVISDSELLSLGDITLGSPISPLTPQIRSNSLPPRPSTPTPTAATISRRRAARVAESFPKIFKKAFSFDKSPRSPIRKSGPSCEMLNSQSFQDSLGGWGNKLNSKFQLDFEHQNIPLSPPQSARVSDASEASSSAQFVRGSHDHAFSFCNGLPCQFNNKATQHDTPMATPVLDGQHSRKTSAQQTFSDIIDLPPTPKFHLASGNWFHVSESSELSSYKARAIRSPDADAPTWWNHAATAPMAEPSPTALHINPQRASKSLAHQLQNDLSYESNGFDLIPNSKMPAGLKIQMPGYSQQPFVISSPQIQSPRIPQQTYFGHFQPPARYQYPPPPRPYVPGASAYTHHSKPAKKTRSAALCRSESSFAKTNSSASQVRKRKRKVSKNTPCTPTPGAVDFVNFTPSDSMKILTGVAPSGSSKTKARREKEAMEKRMNLSIAALRAVRAAGGDVESLVEQGLFV